MMGMGLLASLLISVRLPAELLPNGSSISATLKAPIQALHRQSQYGNREMKSFQYPHTSAVKVSKRQTRLAHASRNKKAVLASNAMNAYRETQTELLSQDCDARRQLELPGGFWPRMKFRLIGACKIARNILRGYLMGQPVDDARPRKGCC